MEGYQLVSYFFTNGLRILGAVVLIMEILKAQINIKKAGSITICVAAVITILQGLGTLQQSHLPVGEMVLLLVILNHYCHLNLRLCMFLLIFYEIAVALWEFLIAAGFAVLYKTKTFMEPSAVEYLAAVWIVRILMLALCAVYYRAKENGKSLFRVISGFAVATFLIMVTITTQPIFPIEEEVAEQWRLMTVILLFAILIFNLNRQYEVEKEVAKLQAQQTELIKKDYQNLNQIYTANAKLYHDLHNHIQMMQCYLTQGKIDDALAYLKDLQAPIEMIAQTVWTGDEAIDYLLNSKLSVMQDNQIETKTNIEFPRNMNIKSADLTTIFGNLLDNAIEAAQKCEEGHRFVYLTVRRIHNILIIKVENSCDKAPNRKDGVIQTTKEDKLRHGWGLKSAMTAAESYGGSLETSFDDNRFCTVITLFF